MLEVIPKSFFSSTLLILDRRGQRGQIRMPLLFHRSREATVFHLDGIAYKPSAFHPGKMPKWWHVHAHLLKGDEHILYSADQSVARATRRRAHVGGLLPLSSYEVEHEDEIFWIGTKGAAFSQLLAVCEERGGQKHEIGSIHVPGWRARRRVIDLPDRLPLYLQVFLFWLSLSLEDPSKSA